MDNPVCLELLFDNLRVGRVVGVSGRARAEHKERQGQISGVPAGPGSPSTRCHAAKSRVAVLLALKERVSGLRYLLAICLLLAMKNITSITTKNSLRNTFAHLPAPPAALPPAARLRLRSRGAALPVSCSLARSCNTARWPGSSACCHSR